jgi:hypothetical protein
MLLLAMSFRPDLKSQLIDEVVAAVDARGGRIDDQWLVKVDLHAVTDEIVERAMGVLSVALRRRLHGIADEMDAAFGQKLRTLLDFVSRPLPTL